MPIDARRYPHFGGRPLPAECSVCHRILMCYVVDDPDDTGEPVCLPCIGVAEDVAWESRPPGPNGVKPRSADEPEAAMWAFADEQCPARGEALTHSIGRSWTCVHCGVRLYRRRVP